MVFIGGGGGTILWVGAAAAASKRALYAGSVTSTIMDRSSGMPCNELDVGTASAELGNETYFSTSEGVFFLRFLLENSSLFQKTRVSTNKAPPMAHTNANHAHQGGAASHRGMAAGAAAAPCTGGSAELTAGRTERGLMNNLLSATASA